MNSAAQTARIETLTTASLWDATHKALCAGSWAQARSLLDDLGLRTDNRDHLCSAAGYGVPEMLSGVIGDRIALVNSKAG